MAQIIAIGVGTEAFEFTLTNGEYNKFVDRMSGGKSVQSAFNLLTATVNVKQRATLKDLITDEENQPKAKLVMDLVGELSEEFTSDLPDVVKLQTSNSNSADETATNNS